MKYETFYYVTIEPSAGADFEKTIREMSALSKKIKMPVHAEFNNYKLVVKPDSDPVAVANEYFFAKCAGKDRRKESK